MTTTERQTERPQVLWHCLLVIALCAIGTMVATFDGDRSIERVACLVFVLLSIPSIFVIISGLDLGDAQELVLATLLGAVGMALGFLISLAIGLNVSNLS